MIKHYPWAASNEGDNRTELKPVAVRMKDDAVEAERQETVPRNLYIKTEDQLDHGGAYQS